MFLCLWKMFLCLWHIDVHVDIFLFMTYLKAPLFQDPLKQIKIYYTCAILFINKVPGGIANQLIFLKNIRYLGVLKSVLLHFGQLVLLTKMSGGIYETGML